MSDVHATEEVVTAAISERLWALAPAHVREGHHVDLTFSVTMQDVLAAVEAGLHQAFGIPEPRVVTVHFAGGPWDQRTTEVDRVVGPVFAVGHEVGNHYWLDSKSDPPTYHWMPR